MMGSNKMKRMIEVFDLPMECESLSRYSELYDNNSYIARFEAGDINHEHSCEAAAHAINHVDALADALETVLHHYGDEIKGEIKRAAVEALKAYRGEK